MVAEYKKERQRAAALYMEEITQYKVRPLEKLVQAFLYASPDFTTRFKHQNLPTLTAVKTTDAVAAILSHSFFTMSLSVSFVTDAV